MTKCTFYICFIYHFHTSSSLNKDESSIGAVNLEKIWDTQDTNVNTLRDSLSSIYWVTHANFELKLGNSIDFNLTLNFSTL